MKKESGQFTARRQSPFRDLDQGLEHMHNQVLRKIQWLTDFVGMKPSP